MNKSPVPRVIAIVCFALSGFAALVCEVCWIRKASLVFGSATLALSTVVAVFFLGLAIGSYLFGRVAQRTHRPLVVYAMLEVILAALAFASPWLFDGVDGLYGMVYQTLGDHSSMLFGVRFALVSLVLLPPTILMGGSLPLFCRQFVDDESNITRSVGMLYGINTLGAAVGCAATGFFLIPTIGVNLSIWLAAGVSAVAGLTVASLRLSPVEPQETMSEGQRATGRMNRAIVGSLFFVTGFVALGGEVLWTRYLSLLVRNTVYTYTMTLSVVLVGIVLGSMLAARMLDTTARRPMVFGVLQMLTGLWVLSVMMLPPSLWRAFGNNELVVYFCLLLPAAVFSGASFPLAVRMVVEDSAFIGSGVGRMAALNTLGGIAGSLAIGFFALPQLGLQMSLLALTGLSMVIGSVAWIGLSPRDQRHRHLAASSAFVVTWLAIYVLVPTRIPADFLASPSELVDIREGITSNVVVVRRRNMLEMEIDRMWQGGEEKHHQVMAAHLPMLLHPDPRSVLVVGVGAGQTPSRFLMYDVDQLDCVDIEPAVYEMIRKHFNSDWMDDSRVRLLHEDGRNLLAHTAEQYDVISLELGQIHRPGVTCFYTAEFYQRARERLRTGGLLSQFVPITYFSPRELQSVVATFLDTFPKSFLWYNTAELLLVGVAGDGLDVDVERLRRLLSAGVIHDDLSFSYWGGPKEQLNQLPVFMANYLCGPQGLADLAAAAPLDRDDLPRLEYAMSQVEVKATNEVPIVKLLREHLEPVETNIPLRLSARETLDVDSLRQYNLGDMIVEGNMRGIVSLLAARDRAEVIKRMSRALTANRKSVRANRVMALALMQMGQVTEAQPHFEAALAVDPDDLNSRRGLAHVTYQLGQVDEAVRHLRAALELEPDDAETHNRLGEVLAQTGQLDEAGEHFRRALKLRPDFGAAGQNIMRLEAVRRSSGQL